jgi:hypothetical protein
LHLVQILLPVRDNAGKPFDPGLLEGVATKLSKCFGGVTAYNRAPAEGRWESSGTTRHDEVLVVEVMVDVLDRPWWKAFRLMLEKTFRQDVIVVRAQAIQML